MNNSGNNENKIVYLRLDDIIPNRFQPREVFDETGLEELADSIKEHGVIQPIIVRQYGNKYELIAGERRSKASALAGFTTIPAIIRNMDDKESAKVSLLENLQRKNLSAIEEARTYKKILELDNMTQEDLAKTMGKSQPLIANKLRLLSLPEEVQEALIKNQISERHARSLLNVKDKKDQLMFLDRIRNERLTVRELDNEIKGINNMINETSNNYSTSSVDSYNNFANLPSQSSIGDYQNNFGNMGLNDYQSQVNNNMFNNIPSNYQTGNDLVNDKYNNFPNINNEYTTIQGNDFEDKTSTNNFSNQEKLLNTTQNISSDYSSLGSMFDNQNSSMQQTENSYIPEEVPNKNIFISQIKEDELQKNTNQFLPNFDDVPVDNNGVMLNGNFINNQEDYSMNSFNEFNNNTSDFNNNLDTNDSNNHIQENNFDYMNNANFNNPIVDHNEPVNSYYDNQGELFNQPLNIIDIPNNNKNDSSMETSNETDFVSDETMNMPIDNPFDDPYENILFAKPVPIESIKENEIDVKDNVEVVDSNSDIEINNTNENGYISLEPEKTIFDTRGAVLELKKTTDQIKRNNINIDTEEIDYDDYYEIIIRIKKDA